MALEVRRLRPAPADDRSDFRSGNIDLDRFFQRFAGQNQFRHHIGTTYVAIDAGVSGGFVTVAPSEIVVPDLPPTIRKKLPMYPLPVLRLARLAVDARYQGRGLGSALLRSVLTLARRMADELGCTGVVVDAKPDAVTFYEKLGFIRLGVLAGQLGDRPEPLPMFLELAAIPEPAGE
jgi:GNAT superfamily N-acetyltransferase